MSILPPAALCAVLFLVPTPEAAPGGEEVVLESELGMIRLQLLPGKAPETVRNFRELARKGFYDGTTFHRAIPGYIVQGGSPTSRDADPRNDNHGGPGYTIKPEFNDLLHDRGMVAMARDVANPDSAGSQFFILLGRSPQLDAIRFTIFARVTSGLELLDRMASAPRDEENHDRPLSPVVLRRVRLADPPAVAAPSAPPARAAAGRRVRINQDGVNAREGPAIDRPVLTRLRKGTELPIKGRQGEWVAVELAGGKLGYVRQDMTEPTGE